MSLLPFGDAMQAPVSESIPPMPPQVVAFLLGAS